MLKVQQYLRTGGTLAMLAEHYAIKATRSSVYPSLVLLKYNQIESPMSSDVVQECRGLILDEGDNWSVVSWPFHKFFNYGESNAAKIDWSSAVFLEKIDGSLMQLYHYGGKWNVASSGNPDAGGHVGSNQILFSDLFWKTWNEKDIGVLEDLNPDFTYLFELTSPENRVVVPHFESNLTLIGQRNRTNGQEVSPHDLQWSLREPCTDDNPHPRPEDYKPHSVRWFPISSLEGALASFGEIDGSRMEGYVVVDKFFNRVKVKHPSYVALHHMRDKIGSSTKNLVAIFLAGEFSELIAYFPEYQKTLKDIETKYESLCRDLDEQYDLIYESCGRGKVNRKKFSEQACKMKCAPYFFARLDEKVGSANEYWRGLTMKREEKLMSALEMV